MIPCFNEEKTLPIAINALPKKIRNINKIEYLVINDGSIDKTLEVARSLNVHHIINHQYNKGLSNAFLEGILKAAELGADYVVNFDADNQYCADDIEKILEPLMKGQADMVVGERPIASIKNFSLQKKILQRFGSFIIRTLSKTNIKDTPSGFRALNQKAMISLQIYNSFTYTNESLINANDIGLKVLGVPIRVNSAVLRPSRLIKSNSKYILKNGLNIFRLYMLYNPYPFFACISIIFNTLGMILLIRFFYFYFSGRGEGLIQSLIIAGILITIGIVSIMMGILSDTLKINRKLLQKNLIELRKHVISEKNK
jgi:glycosyltransferase involved in cell wall biosynthesis